MAASHEQDDEESKAEEEASSSLPDSRPGSASLVSGISGLSGISGRGGGASLASAISASATSRAGSEGSANVDHMLAKLVRLKTEYADYVGDGAEESFSPLIASLEKKIQLKKDLDRLKRSCVEYMGDGAEEHFAPLVDLLSESSTFRGSELGSISGMSAMTGLSSKLSSRAPTIGPLSRMSMSRASMPSAAVETRPSGSGGEDDSKGSSRSPLYDEPTDPKTGRANSGLASGSSPVTARTDGPQDKAGRAAKAILATKAISALQQSSSLPTSLPSSKSANSPKAWNVDVESQSQISGLDSSRAWNVDIEAQTIVSGLDSASLFPALDSKAIESEVDTDRESSPVTSESPGGQLDETGDPRPDYDPTSLKIYSYFRIWTVCTVIGFFLNVANIQWSIVMEQKVGWIMLVCLSLLLETMLNWSSLELWLKSFAIYFANAEDDYADGRNLNVILNYNLLASDEAEVDAALGNALEAYVGNLSPNVVAALVSATNEQSLQNYELATRDRMRESIYDLVLKEGRAWADGNVVDEGRAQRCFESYRNPDTGEIDTEFFRPSFLPNLANKYAQDFMVVQRVHRSLRKCGQYQDLMLLNDGCNEAWTYTDSTMYNELARKYGEHMFYPSEDVDNIQGRRLEYTLVLDGDTRVVKDSLSKMMDVAAANPHRAIIQPGIDITADEDQPVFMHIDHMRQRMYEPVSVSFSCMMGRCGFFGKGLLQNKLYIETMLGEPTEKDPIERVPIDVLSHDTYEAAALCPLYVKDIQLLEEPCGNYVTWNIREGRWNRGELVLSHYFFPKSLGAMFTWLQLKVRDVPPPKHKLRTETDFDLPGSYIAHSALRHMFLKPLLLFYVIVRAFAKAYLYYPALPFLVTMSIVIIIPKFPLVRWNNLHLLVAETACSILQFSPEPIMGTVRLIKASRAHITGVSGWTPQFKVEQDFLINPAIVATFSYQWKMFLCTLVTLAPLYIFRPRDFLLQFLFLVTAFLPFYTTLTALPYSFYTDMFKCKKS